MRFHQRRPLDVVLAAFAVIVLVGVFWAVNRHRAVPPAGQLTAQSPSSPASIYTTTVRVVAVLGDSYAAGSDQGGTGDAGWPSLLAGDLHWDLDLYAVGGTGYVNPGSGGSTFIRQAAQLGPATSLVIVFGSRNDSGFPPAQVEAAARRTYAEIREKAPKARIVVIGPCWPTEYPVIGGTKTEQAVRAAAQAAHVTFINPISPSPWFTKANANLIGTDDVHPTNAGHEYMAQRVLRILGSLGVHPQRA